MPYLNNITLPARALCNHALNSYTCKEVYVYISKTKDILLTASIVLALTINLAFATHTVAVLPSDGTLSIDENELLTDKMREAALKVLPLSDFTLLKQDVVIKRLGGMENYIKECSETSCIVSLGQKAQVDYVSQCRVGKLGNNLRITVELYEVSTGGLLGMFSDVADNFNSLLPLMEKNIHDVFRSITAQRQEAVAPPPPPAKDELITGNTGDLEKAVDAMLDYKEPEKKIDPQVEVKKESNKSFWVALALDIAAVAYVYYGYTRDKEMVNNYEHYVSLDESATRTELGDAWQKVDDARTARNVSFVLGSILLATGIGVHIWF